MKEFLPLVKRLLISGAGALVVFWLLGKFAPGITSAVINGQNPFGRAE